MDPGRVDPVRPRPVTQPGHQANHASQAPAGARQAEQLLRRLAAVRVPAPRPHGPAGDLLRTYLHSQLLSMLEEDRRVRADEPDAVHKMRVSTRRMRSALASYRRILAPEPADGVRGELKWLAGVLGAARDTQVMRSRLQALLATQPADLVLGPVAQRIDEELLDEYRAARSEVLKVLDSARYLRLLSALEEVVGAPDFTAEAEAAAADLAARMLRRDRRRLHDQVRAARAAENGDHRAESLHEARKDAKRLRYAAEVSHPVRAAGAEELIAAAEHVQKILGEHQDSVVTRSYLLRLRAAAAQAGQDGFTYGRLHALEEERGETARRQFRRAWKGFPGLA